MLVRLAGFEPTTPWFVAKYSIQLSYSRKVAILTQDVKYPKTNVTPRLKLAASGATACDQKNLTPLKNQAITIRAFALSKTRLPMTDQTSPLSSVPTHPANAETAESRPATPETPATVQAPATAGVSAMWEQKTIERLLMENLRESRSRRRWKVFFRLAFLMLALLLIGLNFDWGSGSGAQSKPHIALLNLHGGVGAEERINARDVVPALQKAFADPNSKVVVLSINSPGGSPVHANIINQEIFRLRALHPNKQVYTVTEDICASAAYYIASASDKIFVNPASIVGSIGVVSSNFGFDKVMQRFGVERRLMTAGVNKGFNDPFSPQNDKQKQYLQNMLNEIHLQFIGAVKRGRGKRLKENADTFSGLAWVGKQAVEMGLADGFASLDSIVREQGHYQVVDYTITEDLQDRFFKKIGVYMGSAAGAAGAELVNTLSGQAQHSTLK